MGSDSMFANKQRTGDVVIGCSLTQPGQNLFFSLCQGVFGGFRYVFPFLVVK